MAEYKLKEGEHIKLEEFVLSNEGKMRACLDETNEKMIVTCVRKVRKGRKTESVEVKKEFALQAIDPGDAKIERKLLMQEYEQSHEWGRHWDLLRWNWSKFFLGVETIFVAMASKGILTLTDKSSNTDKFRLSIALCTLAILNIMLCIIWAVRNLGIHSWHVASIRRQKLIELDPRMMQTVAFITSIIRLMKGGEGPLRKPHRTGDLESWGPPIVFVLLWLSVIVLTRWFQK